MATIRAIKIGVYALPPATRLVDARHGEHNKIELITVEAIDSDSFTGIGYTSTGGD